MADFDLDHLLQRVGLDATPATETPHARPALASPGRAGMAAVHRIMGAGAYTEGSATQGLGSRDEVFDAAGNVIPVFPSTPEGVVEAALYELHRGDHRALQAIMHDGTEGHVARGTDAAREGTARHGRHRSRSTNTDPATAAHVGHLDGKAVGAIAAYHSTVRQSASDPWCGAFVEFVYQRAGIHAGDCAFSLDIPALMAGSGHGAHVGAYQEVVSKPGHHYSGHVQNGMHLSDDNAGCTETRYSRLPSGANVDIRPGDAFWLEYSAAAGHCGVVIGVHKTAERISIVTVEGNLSDQLRSVTRHITFGKRGEVSSDVKGWGRPAQLNATPAPNEGSVEPAWMSAVEHGRGGSGSSTT